MKKCSWIGRWFLVLMLALMVLALVPPWKASSGEEIDLENYVSTDTAFVGDEITFGTKPIPIADAEVHWNFGDNTEAVGWPVTHTYSLAGYYQVSALFVTPSGSIQARPTHIRIIQSTGNVPPVAKAQVSPRQTLTGQPITFDASGSSDPDGQISRYLWNFGDGSMSNEAKTTYSYAQAGVYHVILTVTDNGEMDKTATVAVTVTALPTTILGGIDRVMPTAAGPAPLLDSPVLVYMGVYTTNRLLYQEYNLPLQPPFRGIATSNQSWLELKPTEFERITGTAVVLPIGISVPNTNLLPRAHTSWAMATIVVNGRIVEMPVAVTVRGRGEDISADVWALYREILTYLTEKDQRGAMVYSPRYPNGADFVLGLITEYIYTLKDGYQGPLTRQDFVTKAAELLMDQDLNGDGVIGFTAQDPDLKVGR
jgi:PKD repeat protein